MEEPGAPTDAAPRVDAGAIAGSLATSATSATPLRRNRDFRVFVIGQGLSSVGDAVSYTALPLLVLFLTGSGFQMGIVGALQMLPDLVFGLPAGAIADRWDRRRIMLAADLARAVLIGFIPLSLMLGIPTMPVIFAVTAPIHLARVLFLAAYTGAVPSIVGREQIGPANSFLEAAYSIGFILGPGIAGVLVSQIGAAPTLAIDAASFVLSAASLVFIRGTLQERSAKPETRMLEDIREGIAFVARHASLRLAIAFITTWSITTGALIPVITFYVTLDRGLPADAVGLVISAYSVGTLLGALVAARLTRRGRLGALMLAGTFAGGLLTASLALFASVSALLIPAFAGGIANSILIISYITFRAAATPDALLGRVGSTARMITLGLQPIGTLGAGALLDAIGGGGTLAVMGLASVVVTLAFALSPRLRTA